MKLVRRIIPLLIASMLIMSCLTGCGGGDKQPAQSPGETALSTPTGDMSIDEQMAIDAQNPITMTITVPTDEAPPEDASILAEFARRTGITFKLNVIPGDPHQKLGMMLASDSLTDIMIIPNDQMLTQYKQSDQVLDLLPYLQKDAPTVYDFYASDANNNMIDYYTEPDGRVLYIMNDSDLLRSEDEVHEDPNSDADYYWLPWATSLYALYPAIDEIAGQKIDSLDDWYQAMVTYHEKYPDNYATTMCNEYGEWMLYAFAQIYGYKVEKISGANFITSDDETYQPLARMPEALDSLKFLNKLHKEGLMDPEGPIQNEDAFLEKLSAARAFTYLGHYEKIYDANDALSGVGEMYVPQAVMADGVTQRWEANTAYLGWQAMMVTTACPDPDRYFRFLEYMFSDEGQILSGWGIEGEDYIINDEGKLDLTPEMKAAYEENENQWLDIGLDFWSSITSTPYHLSDGQFAMVFDSPVFQSAEGLDPTMKAVGESDYNYFRDFTGNYWADPTTLNVILPADSDVSLTVAKIRTPLNDMVCKAIVADSDEEIEQIYNDTMAQLELDGLSDLEQYVQTVIDERRK